MDVQYLYEKIIQSRTTPPNEADGDEQGNLEPEQGNPEPEEGADEEPQEPPAKSAKVAWTPLRGLRRCLRSLQLPQCLFADMSSKVKSHRA